MPLDREPATTSVIDVLDHALDKGIVIDAWLRVSVAGIDLITVASRVVVVSVATYVAYRPHALEEQLHRLRAQMDDHQK
jgi:gas vesicle structural protein